MILLIFNLINLIFIQGETDQTDEKLETPLVESRSTAETEPDLPSESLGKIIRIIELNSRILNTFFMYELLYIKEMDVLKTLDDEEIDEMTPLKTELTDEGEETLNKFRS